MAVAENDYPKQEKTQEQFLEELDKGIDDMEAGRIVEHNEAMQMMKEQVHKYAT